LKLVLSVGWWSSITTGADGFGLISYTDNTNFKLRLIHCHDVACSSGDTPITIDAQGTSSIVVGADGLPLVNYTGANGQALSMFHCTNPTCAPITRVGR
jgi:hypothetical protein